MRSAHRRTHGPPVEKELQLLFNCVDYKFPLRPQDRSRGGCFILREAETPGGRPLNPRRTKRRFAGLLPGSIVNFSLK